MYVQIVCLFQGQLACVIVYKQTAETIEEQIVCLFQGQLACLIVYKQTETIEEQADCSY